MVNLISCIGRSEDNKKNSIKFVLHNELDEENILNNVRILKGSIEFKGISITEDYIVSERQIVK